METFRIAAAALRRHKLRTFLTLLGVIIGVMTIVAVVSVISGLNLYVAEKLVQLNPDVFVVTQFGIITNRDEFLEALRRKKFTIEDVDAIRDLCANCDEVSAGVQTRMPVRRGSKHLSSVDTYGANANIVDVTKLDVESGRFFTPSEDFHSAPVVVIGSDVREELFGRSDPIGKMIQLSGKPLRVIGLLRRQGSVLGESQDNQVYVPMRSFQKRFGSRRSTVAFIRAKGGVPGVSAAEDDVRSIIRNRRKTPFNAPDPFGLVSTESVQVAWRNISAGAFALVTLISAISLIVGGIVIMNIMLVSVIERTREIGVRRAVGARARDIKRQFLTEAMLLSLFGGVVGVILGATISKILTLAFPLPARVTPLLVLVSVAVAVATGAIAGYFPARKASKLPPVESLRWE